MNRTFMWWMTVSALLAPATLEAKDWPFWRGPEQTGLAREAAVVTSWSPAGENLLWKVPIAGRSTPIVMNGRLYAIGPIGEGVSARERVICLDASSGKTIWDYHFNVFQTDVVENRVGWTSLAGDPETGNVYAHGTGGELICFDRDGTILWKVSMTETLARVSGYGGRLMNPVIDEDRVIVSFLCSSWGNFAKPAHRWYAFDKRTGDVVWVSDPGDAPYDTTYGMPAVTVVDGKRMLVAPGGDGNVHGILARTGRPVWKFKLNKTGLNTSAVCDGKYAYVTHSEENLDTTVMGRVVCIDASGSGDITKSGEVWRRDGLDVGYASPGLANGRLYLVDNSANLYCLDARTGQTLWEHKLGRVGKASPTVTADGIIYIGEVNGRFLILRDAGDKCEELDVEEFTGPDNLVDEIYGSAAVCGGRVYFMTRYNSYCLGMKDRAVETAATPTPGAEKPVEADKPYDLVVVPAEISLRPGESRRFVARLFDVNGQLIGEQSAEWTVAGVKGTMSADGTFTAAEANAFSAGLLTAKVGDLTCTARVRIGPVPPFSETFDAMAVDSVPPGWVGVAGKTKIVERDGSRVLQKLAEKPSAPFMRINGYAIPPVKGGCTVQCDVLGTAKKRFRPEIGLNNNRYQLILMSTTREPSLRIVTWSSMPRLQKDVPLAWEPDVWYRMKFDVSYQDDKALVRGKVWPRDGEEPQAWTIEVEDPYPNLEGSPGIYAFSPGTTPKSHGPENYYDNFEVTLHE